MCLSAKLFQSSVVQVATPCWFLDLQARKDKNRLYGCLAKVQDQNSPREVSLETHLLYGMWLKYPVLDVKAFALMVCIFCNAFKLLWLFLSNEVIFFLLISFEVFRAAVVSDNGFSLLGASNDCIFVENDIPDRCIRKSSSSKEIGVKNCFSLLARHIVNAISIEVPAVLFDFTKRNLSQMLAYIIFNSLRNYIMRWRRCSFQRNLYLLCFVFLGSNLFGLLCGRAERCCLGGLWYQQ